MGERPWGNGGKEGEWIKVTQSGQEGKNKETRLSQEQMLQESEELRRKDEEALVGEEALDDPLRAVKAQSKAPKGNN